MAFLAQELIYAIIDEVELDQTLRSCALVSTAFLVPSQRRLFRTISLSILTWKRIRGNLFASALDVFTASPHLASYVRGLYIMITDMPALHAPLTSLLPLLCNVEQFGIDAVHKSWKENTMPSTLKASLLNFLGRPSLQSLTLARIKEVPSTLIIYTLLNVRSVSFTDIGIIREDEFLPVRGDVAKMPTTSSDHLTLGTFAPADVAFMLEQETIGHLHQLRRLDLNVYTDLDHTDWFHAPLQRYSSLRGFEKLALQCSGTLQHLELNFSGTLYPVKLPTLPALRFLHLNAHIQDALHLPDALLLTIENIHVSMPCIELLVFELRSRLSDLYTDLIRAPVNLDKADDALMASLCKAEFRPSAFLAPIDYSSFVLGVRNMLPRADTAGLLTFTDRLVTFKQG
ncbi:hypothetical protein C8J57DRAFT_1463973 [Mycena rebaudengoi]|nr:hypothetical protein C8J57DRAFT_1463973 [Mycena rebaudengoi]